MVCYSGDQRMGVKVLHPRPVGIGVCGATPLQKYTQVSLARTRRHIKPSVSSAPLKT